MHFSVIEQDTSLRPRSDVLPSIDVDFGTVNIGRRFRAEEIDGFGDFSRITQNGNWANVYPCQVYAVTYGSTRISLADGLAALTDFLGPSLGGLLNSLGLGTSSLAALALPLPFKFPNGRAGRSTQQTGVCR